MTACLKGAHDYDGAAHTGRARWICPVCGEDITFELALLREALADTEDEME